MAAASASSFSCGAEGSEGTSAPSSLPRGIVKEGLETPETGTPPPRSVSPSSSEHSAPTVEGPLERQRRREADIANEGAPREANTDCSASQATAESSKTERQAVSSAGGDEHDGDSAAGYCADKESAPVAASATEPATADVKVEGREGREGRSKAKKKHHNNSDKHDGAGNTHAWGAGDAAGQQAFEQPTATPNPFGSGFKMAMPSQAMGGLVLGGGQFSDRRIIEVLAAPAALHKRLLKTANRVPEIILSDTEGEISSNVELYGSLSLDMTEPNGRAERGEGTQDWASYYINGRSDVDFVVEVRSGALPSSIAERLQSKGKWQLVNTMQVHKFASTQYTLHGSFEEAEDADKVYLDVTCIESPLHYDRFKQRQEAFRKVFTDVRYNMEETFSSQGALAFDAYIHLLKAFAAKVPGNALTGFQATCIGLFTLQIGHYKFKSNQSIALSLFEGFLRFCRFFFGERSPSTPHTYWHYHYCTWGIDLSGGRWTPRMSLCWRSELYFMAAEVRMKTRLDERVNVLHSLDPARVAAEAQALLSRAFGTGPPCNGFFNGSAMPAPMFPVGV